MEPNITIRTVDINLCVSAPVNVWHIFLTVISKIGMTVLGTSMHQFPGGGMTGLVLLAESHAAIHTWPEKNYAWCELATCGDPKACDIFEAELKKALEINK